MSKIKVLSIVLLMLLSLGSNASESPFKAVQDLFAGMSAFDYQQMREVVTADFQLLEVGEVWTIDDLIRVVKPSGKKYERRNFFNVIKTSTHGNLVWISYWNKAEFLVEGQKSEVAWLESAVMVKTDKHWKIQMLHSTRIKPERLPANIKLEEYVQAKK